MITELGHFALILGFAVSIIQVVLARLGPGGNGPGWSAVAMPAATVQLVLVAGSFAALAMGFVRFDFSVALVAANSDRLVAMPDRLAALWSSYEGGLLLWGLFVTLLAAVTAWTGGPRLAARALAVQSSVAAAVLGFILFAANPFLRLDPPPFGGAGAVVVDRGLALPLLSLGSAGLVMTFSVAVAALTARARDARWIRWMRAWAAASLVVLSLGIALAMPGAASGPVMSGGQQLSEWVMIGLWVIAAVLTGLAFMMKNRPALTGWTILVSILGFGIALFAALLLPPAVPAPGPAILSDPVRVSSALVIVAAFMAGAVLLFLRHRRDPGVPEMARADAVARPGERPET